MINKKRGYLPLLLTKITGSLVSGKLLNSALNYSWDLLDSDLCSVLMKCSSGRFTFLRSNKVHTNKKLAFLNYRIVEFQNTDIKKTEYEYVK